MIFLYESKAFLLHNSNTTSYTASDFIIYCHNNCWSSCLWYWNIFINLFPMSMNSSVFHTLSYPGYQVLCWGLWSVSSCFQYRWIFTLCLQLASFTSTKFWSCYLCSSVIFLLLCQRSNRFWSLCLVIWFHEFASWKSCRFI